MNRRRVSSLPASFPCVSLTASDRYNPGVPTNSAPVRNAVASLRSPRRTNNLRGTRRQHRQTNDDS